MGFFPSHIGVNGSLDQGYANTVLRYCKCAYVVYVNKIKIFCATHRNLAILVTSLSIILYLHFFVFKCYIIYSFCLLKSVVLLRNFKSVRRRRTDNLGLTMGVFTYVKLTVTLMNVSKYISRGCT